MILVTPASCAAVAVLLRNMERKAVINMIPNIKRGSVLPARRMIHRAICSSSWYLWRAVERTKPPKKRRMMSEKNGARKRDREVPASIVGRSQTMERKRMIKLVTKRGTVSVTQSPAATHRMTRVIAADLGMPHDTVPPEITMIAKVTMAIRRVPFRKVASLFMRWFAALQFPNPNGLRTKE